MTADPDPFANFAPGGPWHRRQRDSSWVVARAVGSPALVAEWIAACGREARQAVAAAAESGATTAAVPSSVSYMACLFPRLLAAEAYQPLLLQHAATLLDTLDSLLELFVRWHRSGGRAAPAEGTALLSLATLLFVCRGGSEGAEGGRGALFVERYVDGSGTAAAEKRNALLLQAVDSAFDVILDRETGHDGAAASGARGVHELVSAACLLVSTAATCVERLRAVDAESTLPPPPSFLEGILGCSGASATLLAKSLIEHVNDVMSVDAAGPGGDGNPAACAEGASSSTQTAAESAGVGGGGGSEAPSAAPSFFASFSLPAFYAVGREAASSVSAAAAAAAALSPGGSAEVRCCAASSRQLADQPLVLLLLLLNHDPDVVGGLADSAVLAGGARISFDGVAPIDIAARSPTAAAAAQHGSAAVSPASSPSCLGGSFTRAGGARSEHLQAALANIGGDEEPAQSDDGDDDDDDTPPSPPPPASPPAAAATETAAVAGAGLGLMSYIPLPPLFGAGSDEKPAEGEEDGKDGGKTTADELAPPQFLCDLLDHLVKTVATYRLERGLDQLGRATAPSAKPSRTGRAAPPPPPPSKPAADSANLSVSPTYSDLQSGYGSAVWSDNNELSFPPHGAPPSAATVAVAAEEAAPAVVPADPSTDAFAEVPQEAAVPTLPQQRDRPPSAAAASAVAAAPPQPQPDLRPVHTVSSAQAAAACVTLSLLSQNAAAAKRLSQRLSELLLFREDGDEVLAAALSDVVHNVVLLSAEELPEAGVRGVVVLAVRHTLRYRATLGQRASYPLSRVLPAVLCLLRSSPHAAAAAMLLLADAAAFGRRAHLRIVYLRIDGGAESGALPAHAFDADGDLIRVEAQSNAAAYSDPSRPSAESIYDALASIFVLIDVCQRSARRQQASAAPAPAGESTAGAVAGALTTTAQTHLAEWCSVVRSGFAYLSSLPPRLSDVAAEYFQGDFPIDELRSELPCTPQHIRQSYAAPPFADAITGFMWSAATEFHLPVRSSGMGGVQCDYTSNLRRVLPGGDAPLQRCRLHLVACTTQGSPPRSV
eukprot:Rhum_TRINITY_DN14385_c26_g1::Rhum_TRINITY_DN14385_c26_g1_i1::g.86218::m.86218